MDKNRLRSTSMGGNGKDWGPQVSTGRLIFRKRTIGILGVGKRKKKPKERSRENENQGKSAKKKGGKKTLGVLQEELHRVFEERLNMQTFKESVVRSG